MNLIWNCSGTWLNQSLGRLPIIPIEINNYLFQKWIWFFLIILPIIVVQHPELPIVVQQLRNQSIDVQHRCTTIGLIQTSRLTWETRPLPDFFCFYYTYTSWCANKGTNIVNSKIDRIISNFVLLKLNFKTTQFVVRL